MRWVDGWAHVEHFSCEPDGVRRAYEVFDPRRIDARGHRFVRHRVGQSGANGRTPVGNSKRVSFVGVTVVGVTLVLYIFDSNLFFYLNLLMITNDMPISLSDLTTA
jgi:hypothetical protein